MGFDELAIVAIEEHGAHEMAVAKAMLAHPMLGSIIANREGISAELFFVHHDAQIAFLACTLAAARGRESVIRVARAAIMADGLVSSITNIKGDEPEETILDAIGLTLCCRSLAESFQSLRTADEHAVHARRTLEMQLMSPGLRRLTEERGVA